MSETASLTHPAFITRGFLAFSGGALVAVGGRLEIDDVPCIVTSISPEGITTRPVTDAD